MAPAPEFIIALLDPCDLATSMREISACSLRIGATSSSVATSSLSSECCRPAARPTAARRAARVGVDLLRGRSHLLELERRGAQLAAARPSCAISARATLRAGRSDRADGMVSRRQRPA